MPVQNLAPYLEINGIKTKRYKEIFTKNEIQTLFRSVPNNPDAIHILIMIVNFGIKTEAGKNRKMFIYSKIRAILQDLCIDSQSGYLVEIDGNLLYDQQFYKLYYDALDKAGVKKKISYSCRYTFATIAHYSGVSDKALQKLMGHTDFSITANSYIQFDDDYIYKKLQKIV